MWCFCMINNENIIFKRFLNCKKVNIDNILFCIIIFGRGGGLKYIMIYNMGVLVCLILLNIYY